MVLHSVLRYVKPYCNLKFIIMKKYIFVLFGIILCHNISIADTETYCVTSKNGVKVRAVSPYPIDTTNSQKITSLSPRVSLNINSRDIINDPGRGKYICILTSELVKQLPQDTSLNKCAYDTLYIWIKYGEDTFLTKVSDGVKKNGSSSEVTQQTPDSTESEVQGQEEKGGNNNVAKSSSEETQQAPDTTKNEIQGQEERGGKQQTLDATTSSSKTIILYLLLLIAVVFFVIYPYVLYKFLHKKHIEKLKDDIIQLKNICSSNLNKKEVENIFKTCLTTYKADIDSKIEQAEANISDVYNLLTNEYVRKEKLPIVEPIPAPETIPNPPTQREYDGNIDWNGTRFEQKKPQYPFFIAWKQAGQYFVSIKEDQDTVIALLSVIQLFDKVIEICNMGSLPNQPRGIKILKEGRLNNDLSVAEPIKIEII